MTYKKVLSRLNLIVIKDIKQEKFIKQIIRMIFQSIDNTMTEFYYCQKPQMIQS